MSSILDKIYPNKQRPPIDPSIPLAIIPRSVDDQCSGRMFFDFKNQTNKSVRLHITKVFISSNGDNDVDTDFKVLVWSNEVDKSYHIDLDPNELRTYGVKIERNTSFHYKIIVSDTEGNETEVCGDRLGIELAELPKANEQILQIPELGKRVRLNPTSRETPADTYIICHEDGTRNNFGIFDNSVCNPTAAYCDIGREGYIRLSGQFCSVLEWDRDTVAYPPDDLMAVHVRCKRTNHHGWIFRYQLLEEIPL